MLKNTENASMGDNMWSYWKACKTVDIYKKEDDRIILIDQRAICAYGETETGGSDQDRH